LKEPTITKNNVFQEFDLQELTGVDTSLRPELGLSIGQAIIDYMLDRIKDDNKGIGGTDLKGPYSKSYINSEPFEAYDKSPNDINMELTGSMLADIDILEYDGTKLKIGFSDTTEKLKSYNHQTGDTVPKREFFGLTKDEVEKVLNDYQSDIDALKSELNEVVSADDIETLADLFQRQREGNLPTFRSTAQVRTLLDLFQDDF
jgi:hypothetical protein